MFHRKDTTGEEGNWKLPHEIHFAREKLRALSLASATLEIEYANAVLCCIVFSLCYHIITHVHFILSVLNFAFCLIDLLNDLCPFLTVELGFRTKYDGD